MQSMHEQYHIRCRAHAMPCETWSCLTSSDNPPHHILVTIEHTDRLVFHDFVTRLVSSHRLALIVIDEAHLALSHNSFRDIMSTLQWLGSTPCQILLISGSAGPSLVRELFAKFGITHYVICREKTSRPNISYNVIRSPTPADTLHHKVLETLSETDSGKAIIFCRSRHDAQATAECLQVPFCHGHMTKDEINAVLKAFGTPSVHLIISTTVLGVALDIPELQSVFHLDYPYNMLSYIQESGHVGRDPQSCSFLYVVIPQHSHLRFPPNDRFGAKLVFDWANNTIYCRRWLMQLFNNGVGEPCSMMAGISHLCDVCRAASLVRPKRGASNTPTADVIKNYLPLQPSS